MVKHTKRHLQCVGERTPKEQEQQVVIYVRISFCKRHAYIKTSINRVENIVLFKSDTLWRVISLRISTTSYIFS
jgi:hypothetical protein